MALSSVKNYSGSLSVDETLAIIDRVQDGDKVDANGNTVPKWVNVVRGIAEVDGQRNGLEIVLPFSYFTAAEKDAMRSVMGKVNAALRTLAKVS